MSQERTTGGSTVPAVDLDRRRFLGVAGALAGAVGVGTGGTAAAGSFAIEHETVASHDGTEIATTLYTPSGSSPNPVVMITHGWGGFRQDPTTAGLATIYANQGYNVLTWDSRGFGDSGGTCELNGPAEVGDVSALIDWLEGHEAVETTADGSPRLGMDGLSYGGGIQLLAATADDRIDAIVPRITWNDLTYSLAPNGGVKYSWLTILLGLGTIGTYDWWEGPRLMDELQDWYVEAMVHNELPEGAQPAFEDRSIAYRIDELDTPTMVVHGLADTLFPPNEAVRTYSALQERGVDSRLLLYRGGHTLRELTVPLSARVETNEAVLDWMDSHLRGADRDVPQVSTELDPEDVWRSDGQFPPADVSVSTLALDNAQDGTPETLERFSWFNSSSVTYTWELPETVELVGTPELELSVDLHGPESRLFARLLHDGRPLNGVREAYHVDGNGHHTVQFECPTCQTVCSAGDTLGIQLSVRDSLFLDARACDGVTIHPEASVLRVPTRSP